MREVMVMDDRKSSPDAMKLIRAGEPTQRRTPWIAIAYQRICPLRKTPLTATIHDRNRSGGQQLKAVQPAARVAAAGGES